MSSRRCECGRKLQTERGLKIYQAKLNAKGRWRNGVLVQLCIQVKRRTIPDRFHTTVPSAFEFPASRKTFHQLGSSSLEEMKDMRFGRSDGASIGK